MSQTRARLDAAIRYGMLVREPFRFAVRELSGRRVVGLYRPRGSDIRVCVRHNHRRPGWESDDTFPLREIFSERCYEPPSSVDSTLRRPGRRPRVVDLGGHLGYFGAFVLSRYPAARVVSFEPEPENARLLRRCIEVNGLHDRWMLIEACAHTDDGSLRFAAGRSIGSHLASPGDENENVVEVAARNTFPYLDGAELVKIDIEGAEWPLLLDARFAAAQPLAVVIEYHSPGCPGDNAKRVATERFAELGYRVEAPAGDTIPEDEPFWGRGLLWAWRGESSP